MFSKLFKDTEALNDHISGDNPMSEATIKSYLQDEALQKAVVKAGEQDEFVVAQELEVE